MEAADQEFECPRCGAAVVERFWGPCRTCLGDLIQAQQGEQVEVEVGAPFEPAMHVVPNHVATKD